MPVRVRIPSPFRSAVDNQDVVELPLASLDDVLAELTIRFPALGRRIFNDSGNVSRFLNLYLNDEDVRFLGSHVFKKSEPIRDGKRILERGQVSHELGDDDVLLAQFAIRWPNVPGVSCKDGDEISIVPAIAGG